MRVQADVDLYNDGSVSTLTPRTEAGRAWIDDNLALEPWQWLGRSVVIEWRYAEPVVEGMAADGLSVAIG